MYLSSYWCRFLEWFRISVKEKATSAYLYMAYVVSMTVMGGMVYLLYEELLAPGAPQTVFSKSLSLIKKDPDCVRLLGGSIVGYAEGHGRIKQIAHHIYKKVKFFFAFFSLNESFEVVFSFIYL